MTKELSGHDFINNGLRIEIITKLIAESIEKKEEPQENLIEDLFQALKNHKDFLEELKPL